MIVAVPLGLFFGCCKQPVDPSKKPEQTGASMVPPLLHEALYNGASVTVHWPLPSPYLLGPSVLITCSPRPNSRGACTVVPCGKVAPSGKHSRSGRWAWFSLCW